MNPNFQCPAFINQITVDAWVDSTDCRAERMQALISKWSPLDSFDSFDAFDAAGTDGLNSTGYFGAVFDGRFVYFSPEQRDSLDTHAVVLRYDTHGDFKDRNSYAACDASKTSGLEVRGFYGAAFDGVYVYFVPRQIGMEYYHTRFLRFDSRQEFKNPAAWVAFDLGLRQSAQGVAFDGRYLFFSPGFSGDPKRENEYCANVIRYDTRESFSNPAGYATADVTKFLGMAAGCYDGAAFDGRFIYLVPLYSRIAARYDTHGKFDDLARWQKFDMAPLGAGSFVGAVFDGRHLYYCPYACDSIVRFDTLRDFLEPSSWQCYRSDRTKGLRTNGFDGGFFDGRFVYFVPFVFGSKTEGYTFHSNFLRYDSQRDFEDPKSWEAHDASRVSGLDTVGYNAGAFDGRYFYCAPWRHGAWDGKNWRTKLGTPGVHGTILRYDTIGQNGSFSLRYCDYGHNGGLTATVLGPSFLVNTTEGVRSVATHNVLSPGGHRLTGIYDGKRIQLWIDGRLEVERASSGHIVNNQVPITVGRIQDGLGEFQGSIERVEILATVPSRNELFRKQ
jgi:hypothetical protein